MRRNITLALSAFLALSVAATASVGHAQMGGRGGQGGQGGQGGGDEGAEAGKKKKRDEEWNQSKAPLAQLRNAGPCPYVKVLYDASRYVEFKDGKESPSATGFTGEIQGISSGCAYKSDDPIKSARRGPVPAGPWSSGRRQPPHLPLLGGRHRAEPGRDRQGIFRPADRLLAGQDRIFATETLNTITIPRADAKVSGGNFEVLVGFDVTPEMAAFNRDGKRFRVNAGHDGASRPEPSRDDHQAMSDLKRSLSEAAAAAFEAAGLSPEFGRVTASDRPDLADFQCNGALAAAKSAKRNPREIAVQVVDHLKGDPRLASVEIAGVGFINMRVSAEACRPAPRRSPPIPAPAPSWSKSRAGC
jgi:hypothetical protein